MDADSLAAGDAKSTAAVTIEVAFALPDRQKIVTLAVKPGTTAREAVRFADMSRYFPDLPETTFIQAPLGIFGKRLRDPERHELQAGDRVEIYRPLLIDPKQARAKRAADASR
ncbi:RnfH family protein [Halomonas sp. McH1-25]|uniref:RnfH family protein n=1 Tax=unclassified Halomonas TaxID=2609666 RepID=UPI001EF6C1F0|nr:MULTISPECIES: RnfH family protein [unclassified Halomonas]MCG7599463.1 RnfH family protein [Halomonas sp. McH1-25]MCP1342850.1 RnfH family protein [Halomonas sp. FL8]MCP1361965.1 RnfH family protein [Halomonas sp. BBD45]MCP1366047.1 RnfH family protein [Halomonas sp. BBD48]